MNRIVVYAAILLLCGCSAPRNEFERTEDYQKRIADGLYFIREGALGRILETEEKVVDNWEKRALTLCNGNYEKLIYEGFDHRFSVTDPEVFIFPAWGGTRKPIVHGVVHCHSSALNREQAIQMLMDKYYLTKKP